MITVGSVGVGGGGNCVDEPNLPQCTITVTGKRQNQKLIVRRSCLRNLDTDTLAGLGLDALGVLASTTGLKAAWTAGSAAAGATVALLSVTLSGFTADSNKDQAVALGGSFAAVGAPLVPEGANAASRAIAASLPGVGIAVSGGILVYDSYNALKKAGCFG